MRTQRFGPWTSAASATAFYIALLGWSPNASIEANQGQEPSPARSDSISARSVVRALARLEPATGLISVGVRPGMRILDVKVKEGDLAAKGVELAVVEGRAPAVAQLLLAEAQKARVEFTRELKREAGKLEREQADQTLAGKLSSYKRLVDGLNLTLGLARKLREKVPASGEGSARSESLDLEIAQLMIKQGEAEVELEAAKAEQKFVSKKRALEDKQLNDATELDVLDKQIALAKAALAETSVVAPSNGTVLALSARPGEVSSGVLLVLGDLSKMIARAEVFASDLDDVAIGAKAEVAVDGKKTTGRVAEIGRVVGRNRLQSLDPTALADRRVVEVSIALDDATEASHYVNMQVDVSIERRRVRP